MNFLIIQKKQSVQNQPTSQRLKKTLLILQKFNTETGPGDWGGGGCFHGIKPVTSVSEESDHD